MAWPEFTNRRSSGMIENWFVLASVVAANVRKAAVARTAARASVRTEGRERRVTDPPPVGVGFGVGTLEGRRSCGRRPCPTPDASVARHGPPAAMAGWRARASRPDPPSPGGGLAALRDPGGGGRRDPGAGGPWGARDRHRCRVRTRAGRADARRHRGGHSRARGHETDGG